MNHDQDFQWKIYRIYSNADVPEADNKFNPDKYDDSYIRMELVMPRDGDGPEFAQVTNHLKDANGLPIGTENSNPTLDTQMYGVEYQDGYKASLTANKIVHNLFSQVDEEGNWNLLFDEIIDHISDGNKVKQ